MATMHPDLKPGIRHTARYTVPVSKTVPHLYPEFDEFQDMPEVFATGFLVGLVEAVCQLAIKPYLDWPREQSLGTRVDITHVAATPPGLTVTVACEVLAVEGRRVRFSASAHDGHELVSEGRHERVVIDTARFGTRLAGKVAAGLAGVAAADHSPHGIALDDAPGAR
jgi:fluoroacetyl-CoA thioesterase